MRTQNPALRITRWLRSRRQPIPLEAECTACDDAQFKIKYDKRSEPVFMSLLTPLGPPEHDSYMNALQNQYEEHLKLVHRDQPAAKNITRKRGIEGNNDLHEAAAPGNETLEASRRPRRGTCWGAMGLSPV